MLLRIVAALLGVLMASVVAAAAGLDLPYTLTKPNGDGPFPAIVLLHDCSGLGPHSSGDPWRWATRFSAQGYVTIAPDSFSQRGHAEGVCTDASAPVVTFVQRSRDAYAALAYLRTLPFVDPRRIALLGGSHGGSSVLATIIDVPRNHAEMPGFAAAIALYPGCGARYGDWKVTRSTESGHRIESYSGAFRPLAPLFILDGALDDWTPAEPCQRLADAADAAGYPVEIHTYPDARHSFDSTAPLRFLPNRINANSPSGFGATTEGNREDWADAVVRVEDFLTAHLTP